MKRILLVDDNEALANLLSLFLREKGFHVLKATRPDEAIAFSAASMPDVAAINVRLSSASGYDLAALLRARPETSRIPILFTGTRATAEDLERVKALGGLAYLDKPFPLGALLVIVRKLASEPVWIL